MRKVAIIGSVVSLIFPLLLFVAIMISDEEDINFGNSENMNGANLSAEVLEHKPMVEKYCNEFGISDYVYYLLAIMQVESGGKGNDVMQASESLGLPVNTLDTEASIKQGCKYFSELLNTSKQKGCDIDSVIQSYNYGGGFLDYIERNGKKYRFELAEAFSKDKAGGVKVDYKNEIAIPVNGGWRYNYGNMFYVQLVKKYLSPPVVGDDTFKAIMKEALKYQGWPYVFGGKSPQTSFDCSGLTSWVYKSVNITIPHGADGQYRHFTKISSAEARAGDLVFFHSTYGNYPKTMATHVGIYCGDNKMYHAGDPIGYTDLNNPYWQSHLLGYGRVPKN